MVKAENTHHWGKYQCRLVSSLTSLDSTASLHTNNRIFSFMVKSNLVKLETSRTVILPPPMIVLLSKVPIKQQYIG